MDARLSDLSSSLLSDQKIWGPYDSFTIFDPKEREIKVAPLEDRIAYHAILNICESVFDSYQIYDSYACRKGKGQQAALLRAKEFSHRFDWYLKCDIRKYFDSISHSILIDMLERRFKDRVLHGIFNNLIASYHSTLNKGIPIGSLTSQFFANHYLGTLDHFVKRDLRVSGYVRYMDDFILWDKKERLQLFLEYLNEYCTDRLQLDLKTAQINRTSVGLPFLGMRVYPGSIRLSHRARYRFRDKIKQALSDLGSGILTLEGFCAKIRSLTAFTRMANSMSFRMRVLRENGICP